MSQFQIKGFALEAALRWLETFFKPNEQEIVRAALPSDFQAEIPNLRPEEWYPVEWFDSMSCAIAEVAGEKLEDKHAAIEACTGFVAKENLNTVMKLLMKFMTPKTLAKSLPKMWAKYFKGTDGATMEISSDKNEAVMNLTNFDGLRWNAPIVLGWIRAAFQLLGAENAEVQEVLNDPNDENPSSFRWEMRW